MQMGSLMAGWDSHIPDPKAVIYQRNLSSTKGEIEAYRRSKEKVEEEHLRTIPDSSESSQEISTFAESGGRLQRSRSLPLANKREDLISVDANIGLEKLIKKNGWWASSNWAFLNDPPEIATECPSYKYASQYHITDFGSPKPDSCTKTSTRKTFSLPI
ncbi:hypothetical protein HHK36_031309 [Tetracentron sinense]|uniref:Uncharacterized protein n=1 Tax=Tetracentron sinense TaxID=13715 RepID=A0A835D1L2_TETSI|nr:hypothetical protein HHK36_031309 [Tetracentron sinense]